jgi:serine/threonine-protein kinase RsbW
MQPSQFRPGPIAGGQDVPAMISRRAMYPANLRKIESICRFVGEATDTAGFDERTRYACQLAVGEACENIIIHGYGGEGRGDILVNAEAVPGEITVELRDTAPPFNPAGPPPQLDLDRENPQVGGVGLVIIHRVMDEIYYSRDGDQNCLTLRRKERRSS